MRLLAQRFHLKVQRLEGDAGHGGLDILHLADGNDIILNGQAGNTGLAQQLRGHLHMAYARADGVHRKAGALLLRRLDIAEICNHGADAGSHQQQTLARVGAQVENIGCIMQQRGRTLRQHCQQFVCAFHACPPLSFGN